MRDILQFIKWIIKTTFETIVAAALFILFIGFILFALDWVVTNMDSLEKIIENPQTFNYWAVAKYIGFLIAGVWLLVPLLAGTEAPLDTPPARVKIQK